MTDRSVTHGTFAIERTYTAPPSRVFAAWADQTAKDRWFGSGDTEFLAVTDLYTLDFRRGGHERLEGSVADGRRFGYDATYLDIVDGERLIHSYEVSVAGRRTSVSLVTVEFEPVDDGTRLVLTEQGVFIDTRDNNELRQEGASDMLDKLGAYLEVAVAA